MRISLALRDAKTGRLLRIKGNPHRQTIRGGLRTGERRLLTLMWSNYCGPGRPLVYELTLGERRVRERDRYPGARCETATVPSTLSLFRIRRR